MVGEELLWLLDAGIELPISKSLENENAVRILINYENLAAIFLLVDQPTNDKKKKLFYFLLLKIHLIPT